MHYGNSNNLRAKLHLRVLQGWDGNGSNSLFVNAKPKVGEAIYSGMAVVLDDNGEWVKALGDATTPVFVAWEDQDSPDVQGSGVLKAFPVYGGFKIQTGYFSMENGQLAEGLEVTVSVSNAGYFCRRTADTQVLVGRADGWSPSDQSQFLDEESGMFFPAFDNSALNLQVAVFTTMYDSPAVMYDSPAVGS